MAFEEVEKGARGLIREVLRERGIKSKSEANAIYTVCYAHHPLYCIEYQGPVKFTYHEGVVSMYITQPGLVSGFDSAKMAGVSDTNNSAMLMQLALNAIDAGCLIDYLTKFEIASPTFSDQIGELLDRVIKPQHTKAPRYKLLLHDTKSRYVADTAIEKLVDSWWLRLKRTYQAIRGTLPDDGMLWRHAIQRYCRVESEELDIIVQMVEALRRESRSSTQIEKETKQIIDDISFRL